MKASLWAGVAKRAPQAQLPRIRPSNALADVRGRRGQLVASSPSSPAVIPPVEHETGLAPRDAELSGSHALTRWEKLERAVGWQRAEVLPALPHANREVEGPLPLWLVAVTPAAIALLAYYGFGVFTWAQETSPAHYLAGRTRDRSKRRAPYPEFTEAEE